MPRKNGFTLIETLIASAVLIIFITAVLTILNLITQSLGEARVRSIAIQLAQDRIELAHNLEYEQVGVSNGIPSGALLPQEIVDSQGTKFEIRTSVLYIDDVFDAQSPDDLFPADYKRVRIAVTWDGMFTSKKPVVLMANISPPGLEADVGGGTLSVLVFNAQGQPLDNALVHIEASSLNPPINLDAYTDINGKVNLPGTPTCSGCFKISVSKDGHTSDRTYGTDEVANPYKPHLSIIESRVSEVSFAIDTVSNLTIKATRSKPTYVPFSGVNLIIQGTKEIGRTADDEPVYKVTKSVTTSTGGQITIPNLEWDRYTIIIPPASSIDFAGSWPFNPIPVEPGQSAQVTLIVTAASDNSFLVQMEDTTRQPIDVALAELTQPGFIASSSTGIQTAGDYSQAFFSGLIPGIYDLKITSSGFDTATASVSISGDKIEKFTLSRP